MKKHRHKGSHSIGLTLLGLAGLGILLTALLRGTDVAILNPKGLIAGEQFRLIIFSVAVMLVIGVPTLFLLYYFAWKYRESNDKPQRNPDIRHGKLFVLSLWAMPTVIMLVLAFAMWGATHKLEPQKRIAVKAKPMTIQVIAMRWKWLFIYPEQNIATVNFVQVPAGTPVEFQLTADEAPMNSFWIPHWGGQLYAMTGHSNRLNLLPEKLGDYPGSAAEINGKGFAGMKFTARASTKKDFDAWVLEVRKSQDTLDTQTYEELVKPSQNNKVVYYASSDANLFGKVLTKYSNPSNSGNDGEAHH